MNRTPVEILGTRYPLSKKEIIKTSIKWEKRTRKLNTKWPAVGTLDVTVCEEMETLIKNYKPKDKKQKRKNKRERENEILKMFKEERVGLLQSMKTAREVLKKNDNTSKEKTEWGTSPPPYSDGQFPMITGHVEIKGEVEVTEEKEGITTPRATCAPSHSTEQGKKRTMKHIGTKEEGFDCYSGLRKALTAMETEIGERETSELQTKITKDQTEGNSRKSQNTLAEWASGNSPSEAEEEEEEEENDPSCRGQIEREGQIVAQRIEEKLGRSKSTHEENIRRQERQDEALARSMNESLRNEPAGKYCRARRNGSRKESGYYEKQWQILIKGEQGHYIPWAAQDMEGLVFRLPDLHEGAGKWIRTFEEYTMGKLVVVGDIKALLGRVTSVQKLREIMQDGAINGTDWEVTKDGLMFDRYRPAVWRALRAAYPTKFDLKALRGEAIGATENPATYLHGHLERWRMETEQDPEGNELMTAMFRTSVMEAMPEPVRNRLEDVVGLTSKPYKEFCDYVIHAVEKHRKDEQRQIEQGKDIQRKLAQLQLDELTNKGKKKVHASVTTPVPEVGTMSAVSPGGPQPSTPRRAQMPTVLLVVNVYTQPPNWNGGNKQQKNTQADQRKGPRNPRGPPGVCWGCHQSGHSRRECPTNPWQDLTGGNTNNRRPPTNNNPGGWQPHTNGNGGWPGNQSQPSGPVNPWSGPNQTY